MAFGIEPQFWLNLQTQFDLETIRRELGERLAEIVSRLPEAAAAREARRGVELEDGIVVPREVSAQPLGNRRWAFDSCLSAP